MTDARTSAEAGTLYFAYGSNLNQADWERWCQSRGYPSGLLRFHSKAVLPDHRPCFSYRSASRGGGVLDVVAAPGQVVPGAVFEVTAAGWQALDEKEGAPFCYRRIAATVLGPHGEEMRAATYQVQDSRRETFVEPNDEYLEIVRTGCRKLRVDAAPVLAAAKDERSAGRVDAFFVYGTLMRGESRFPAMKRSGIHCALLAEAWGRLVDLGSYPGLVDLNRTESLVQGEFVRVRDVAKAIRDLDTIEGFRGFGKTGSLYRRTLTDVGMCDGRVRRAWTYCLAAGSEAASEIPSHDWREHCGRREAFLADLCKAHARGDELRVAKRIAASVPFSFNPDAAQSLLPLASALARGMLSERQLAQGSRVWAALA